jgi:serine/threonine protein kinase
VPDQVGRTLLKRYRVDEFLGRGGMAEVYRAWDAERSVSVALKVLNENLAGDYVFTRRFAREAHALELLQHPNIVRFFGFEEAEGLAFLVMEYVDGVTLRRQLRLMGSPLTFPEALAVLQPVCSALHYAHEMGVYHCDVKPANIFIERSGRVLLGDFGIARLSESATVTSSTTGTPAYMAPEQCRGDDGQSWRAGAVGTDECFTAATDNDQSGHPAGG